MVKGDVILCLEDFIIPGTGMTFYYYKGNKYRVKELLKIWDMPAWSIKLMREKEDKLYGNETGYFTEEELFKRFDCVKYQRILKLRKLNKLNEQFN